MKIVTEDLMQKGTCLSAARRGALDDSSRRESLEWSGLTSGVKARRRAFTLIELLVVIAIIAILAAILLPVLSSAQATSKKAFCINNFKQLQICYRMYVDDNKDYLPLNFLNGVGSSWISYNGTGASAQNDYNTLNIRTGVLFQYNKNAKIYVCPANNYNLKVGAAPGTSPPYRDDFGNILKLGAAVPETRTCSIELSMGGNNSGNGAAGPWTISSGGVTWNSYYKFSQILTRNSAKIVFVDEAAGGIDDGAFGLWAMNSGQNYWWNLPTARHDNGCVFGFADGHVEYYKWHGTAVQASQWQTTGPGTGGGGIGVATAISADSSTDLARVQAGGPVYP
ncbi:MAG TPA: prepilin-type N-terminal cleavage/methylation domain-containing protein [Verrucomicrobiae bacterium]|jgi:prepilin-type N-terminal cleavage/methylation domain-containing protein/prepilin-type processing-associated H-X9-DG protein|nr:prepilin-type N-terminal cleavage/methylation domain-containing protein [Verrucomicrobiae bacterium]